MEKIVFSEEQRFTQTWLWLLILSSFGIPLIIIGIQLITAIKEKSDEVFPLCFFFLFLLIFGIAMVFLFLKMKLLVEITQAEIRFMYPPLQPKWKIISKTEIERFEVRNYRPISEYGGWGIRSNWKKRNVAYNVSGNIGLQLFLKSGNKILLGTQQRLEIEYAMGKLMKKVNSD